MTKTETNLLATLADHLRQGGLCADLDVTGAEITGRGKGWTFGRLGGLLFAWVVDEFGAYGVEITAIDLAECEA